MTSLKIAWIYFRRVFFLFNLKGGIFVKLLKKINYQIKYFVTYFLEQRRVKDTPDGFIRPYKLFIEEGNVYGKLIKLKIPIMHALRLFLGPTDERNKWAGL